jgi:hypothetical protein
MRAFDYLNSLAAAGQLIPLYKAGVVTVRCYAQRELVLYYTRLTELATLADDPRECAERTARDCKVDLSTVYRAIRAMSVEVEAEPLGMVA